MALHVAFGSPWIGFTQHWWVPSSQGWSVVGLAVGAAVGFVGAAVGVAVGESVGAAVGVAVGKSVGAAVGIADGVVEEAQNTSQSILPAALRPMTAHSAACCGHSSHVPASTES